MKRTITSYSLPGMAERLRQLERAMMDLQRIKGGAGGSERIGGTEIAGGGSIPFLVAASDAPDEVKAVSDYVCDGTADEVEINAAILAAQNAAVYKPVVHLSEGNFSLSAPIDYLTGLQGASPSGGGSLTGATYLQVDTAMTGPVVQVDALSDLVIQVGQTVTGTIVDVYNVMSHVGIDGGASTGVAVTVYGTDARITDCHISNPNGTTGFDVQTSGAVSFVGTVVDDGVDGIVVSGAGRISISGCVFRSMSGTGVDAGAGIVAVAGCVFDTMPVGIDDTGGSDLNTGAAAANTFRLVTTPVA